MRQQMLRGVSLFTVAACVLLTNVGRSEATLLAPGTALFPAPIGGVNGGALIDQLNNIGFVATTFTGNLTSHVFQNDPTNPFGLGALTFTYQIENTSVFPVVPGEIDRFTNSSFAGFLTDVQYVAGPGVAPAFFDRSVGVGDTIGITFAPTPIGFGAVLPGKTTDLLIVYTNATRYAQTTAALLNGSRSEAASFAPLPVPEPSTVVLAGLAAVGMALAVRRKRA